MALQAVCPHCNATESALHLFFTCPFAQQVWRLAPFATPVDWLDINTPHQALIRATSLLNLPPTGLTSDLVSWILWGIWKARNLFSFEHRATTAPAVMTSAISGAREWSMAQQTNLPRTSTTRYMERPPTLPTVLLTCNSDAVWRKETNNAGLGWVIIGSQDGLIYEGQGHARFVSSPLMAEALAVKGMLLAASHLTTTNVWIRSDSLELIRAINSNTYPMELYGVLKDIEFLSASFDFIYFSHISRSCNSRADSLAKNALLCDHSTISLEELNANFNQLTMLPDTIGFELTNMTKLSVNSNKIVMLPSSLSHLTSLRVLDARLNRLRSLPDYLENLVNLQVLTPLGC
ncbi:unnamed protein product [Brassica oleracea]